jgi:HEAT repeat protein
VRRGLLAFVLCTATLAVPARAGAADRGQAPAAQARPPDDPWQIRRDRRAALREQSLRALIAAPDDPGEAARLVRRLPDAEAGAIAAALAARAAREPRYPVLMARAQLLAALERHAEALPAFEAAGALAPRALAPLAGRARALERLGRADEAAAAYAQLAAREPPAARQRTLGRLAALYLAAGDLEAAERALRDGLDAGRGRGDLASYRRLAELSFARGNGTALAAWLEPRFARAAGGERRVIGQALAELLERLADFEAALSVWQRLAGLPGAERRVLALLERLDRKQELGRRFDRLAARGGALEALLEIVEHAYERGDRAGARGYFDRLLARQRRSGAGLARLADVAARFGDAERVLASWDALAALDPRDERAIVGLGEAHFQGGRPELARRTWGALLSVVRPPARAHARLAELLGDHDMLEQAVAEARAAQRLEPSEPAHHRTLARILEKQREPAAAISEWRAVLQGTGAPGREGERREARARVIALLAREGRERLRAETVLLKDRARRHPEDRESAVFLAELQLRLGEPGEAVDTLQATAERRPRDAEIVLLLVRLLRQSHQTERALQWLERLAREEPARGADAALQAAALRLDRYQDEQAFATAAQALAAQPAGPELALRAAELEERAGRAAEALRRYEAASEQRTSGPQGGRAALAAARAHARRGDGERALAALTRALPRVADPELRGDLLAEALQLAEYQDRTTAVLARLGPPGGEREQQVALELARRAVPALARRAREQEAAARALALLAARLGGVLLERLTDARAEPEPELVDLAGMLGNRDAVPALVRLLGPERRSPPGDPKVAAAAAVALGRLGDARALPALAPLSEHPSSRLRAAATWALGRLGDPRAEQPLLTASRDPRPDIRALALLGLGRLAPEASRGLFTAVVADPGAPVDVRRAALVALARRADEPPVARLPELLESPDPGTAACAALALGRLATPAGLPALWQRALLGPADVRRLARRALALHLGREAVPDEAAFIAGSRLQAGELLDAVCASGGDDAAGAALEPLAVEHAGQIGRLLAGALAAGGEPARRALAVVDGASDEPGSPVASLRAAGRRGPGAVPAAAGAWAEITAAVREPLGRRLADADAGTRLLALRVAAGLGDPRLGTGDVGFAAGCAAPGRLRPAEAALDPTAVALRVTAALREAGRLDTARLARELGPLLGHADWRARLAAVTVLAAPAVSAASGPGPTGPLRAALDDPSPFVREAAVAGLGGDPPALARAALDPSAAVRRAVAGRLLGRTDPAARAILGRLAGDPAPAVRAAAAAGLAVTPPGPASAAPR